jgi:hypothetical protein
MSRIPLSQEDRDLNKKVALALGWRNLKALKIQSRSSLLLEGVSPRHSPPPGAGFRARQYVPNFAGDMNSALELLEELRSRGYDGVSLTRLRRTRLDGAVEPRWECFLEDPLGRRVAEFADTPARAVCLALLNALGSGVSLPAERPKRRAAGREPRAS